MSQKLSLFLAVFAVFMTIASPVHAEVPTALEPQYSEAVLAYNAQNYQKAVALLDALTAKNPNVPEFFELKALSLKVMKDPARAAETYESLIKVKMTENRPEREAAPYHFELGQIFYEKGNYAKSAEHFQKAIESNFNAAASHFFLGMLYFKTKSYDRADSHFHDVLRGDVDDLKPSANYYLGQVALATKYPSGATQSFYAARATANEQMNAAQATPESKKMAQQIYDAADANLKPFNKERFFGNVSLISGYDSNVLSVPSSQSSTASGGTGQASVKETLQAGIGYMTSPLNSFQFVPSYKGSFNYNFNQDTRTGQFMAHDVSLYITRNALASTSYGFKIDGTYIFQDQVDPDTQKGTFKPYSLGVAFGPYWKKELSRKATLGAELTLTPTHNYGDDSLGETYARSGADFLAKVSIKGDTGAQYWNPSAYVGYDNSALKGDEYKSNAFLIGVSDAMHLSDATHLNFTIDFSPVTYGKRPSGARHDKVFSIDGSLSQKLNDKVTLVGEVQWLNNGSDVPDTYEYKRTVFSAGLGYSL